MSAPSLPASAKKRKEDWNDANLKKESEITKDLFFFIQVSQACIYGLKGQ